MEPKSKNPRPKSKQFVTKPIKEGRGASWIRSLLGGTNKQLPSQKKK